MGLFDSVGDFFDPAGFTSDFGDVVSTIADPMDLFGSRAGALSDKQADSYQRELKAQKTMYRQARRDQKPWMEAGQEAIGTLGDMTREGAGEYQKSPYYDFRLEEGLKGIDRRASATGGYNSGARIKERMRFGQDSASQDYQSFMDRYYKSLTPYQSMAGVGQTSAGSIGQMGTATAGGVTNSMLSQGQTQGSQYVNQANNISNLGNQASYGAGMYGGLSVVGGGSNMNTPDFVA